MKRIAWLVAIVASGCIIPDREIGIESDAANPGAVRILQPTLVTDDMITLCNADPNEGEDLERTVCPQVPPSPPAGLLRSDTGAPFCTCPGDDFSDQTRLQDFSIYAEDPDRRQERPRDTLYGVALLDLDPFADDPPSRAIAYPDHFPPGKQGEPVEDWTDLAPRLNPSIGREDNWTWRFRFGKGDSDDIDLCNDNGGDKVSPGLHTLTIMVTDRPFYVRPRLIDGEPDPELPGTDQYGMPDLAAGATYSTVSWVFECIDGALNDACLCAEDPA
jgi:hypothetical protein